MEAGKVFLLPGELFVSKEPVEIVTLLGSCVGICLYNRRGNFGGMNHYMLPEAPTGEVQGLRHGDYSVETLIKMMLSLDPVKGNIEASVLGGGNVTGHLMMGVGIGSRNIVMAKTVLEKHGIKVIHKDVGGEYGRKIYFQNWTGHLEVRKIEKSAETRMVEEKVKDIKKRKIKVLIVDDSKTVRDIIADAISKDPQIEVSGQAANPYEARELLLESDPDVICLDIIMPKMDGITFLKKLFLYKPKPVIIISTVAQKGSDLRKQAEQIGAVDVIDKEDLNLYKGDGTVQSILAGKIKQASTVWVRKKTAQELEGI